MKYVIGLDIGTTSVGWAVINKDSERIENLGVRHFESAENPKDGKSLAEPRRNARSLRRRLDRRGYRLSNIKNIFITSKLLAYDTIQTILNQPNNPYLLRVKGLNEQLTSEELFISIYHIAKRRGYKSNRKKVVEGDPKEGNQVLHSIHHNELVMKEHQYRSVAERLVNDFYDKDSDRFTNNIRNKSGSYSMVVSREMLLDELKSILDAQVKLGAITEIISDKLYSAVEHQRHYASGEQVAKMVGQCTLNPLPGELRSSKSTPSFQLFNALQRLNNLRVIDKISTEERGLTEIEITKIIAESKDRKETSYKAIRKSINLPDTCLFKALRYAEGKDAEAEKCFTFSTVHELKKAISSADSQYWESIKNNIKVLDQMAQVLTLYKTDKDITTNLKLIPETTIPEGVFAGTDDKGSGLLSLAYNKFCHLSLSTLYKIIPGLENGNTYDKACELAGIDHRARKGADAKKGLLPPLSPTEYSLTNPVVRRSVSQTIKVVNAIVRQYGKPSAVHIEFARELAKNFADRKTIEKNQKANQENNTKAITKIRELLGSGREPTGIQIVKYKLWEEQGNKCIYSGKTIDDPRVSILDDNYCQVDHIIPWSRSFDDSYTNKVLVLCEENQNKGNRLPFEYFGDNADKWEQFEVSVNALNLSPRKKRNLLLKNFKLDTLTSRTLNDTRYISRFVRNYIHDNLAFAEDADKNQKIVTPGGAVTAYLRKRWGLEKARSESLRHHAQDAVVVACASQSFVQRVSLFSKTRELQYYLQAHKDLIDPETGKKLSEGFNLQAEEFIRRHDNKTKFNFPQPWHGFREELQLWLSPELNTEEDLFRLYREETQREDMPNTFKPLLVSKMPIRKASGQAHDQTLRSPKLLSEGLSSTKVKLENLTMEKLDRMKGKQSDMATYITLKERLDQYSGDAKKAFAEPIYKPAKSGQGNIIRSITILEDQKSGLLLNNGQSIANNDSMVRIDIFTKPNKRGKTEYYISPVYAHHIAKGELPSKVVTAKTEDEWAVIDDTFEFLFSLYTNDFVRLEKSSENAIEGYYRGMNRANGSISIISHDNAEIFGSQGVKTLAKIEKYSVDVLGNHHKVGEESRR